MLQSSSQSLLGDSKTHDNSESWGTIAILGAKVLWLILGGGRLRSTLVLLRNFKAGRRRGGRREVRPRAAVCSC